MNSLADVFRVLNQMRAEGVVREYAVGGATAVLFYIVHGVPVQVLPAYNALVVSAVAAARTHDYDGEPVNVVDPEHLVALALQAGGARRRERDWQLLQSDRVDRARLRTILSTHGIHVEIPDDV